jgi:hypothetical protein
MATLMGGATDYRIKRSLTSYPVPAERANGASL